MAVLWLKMTQKWLVKNTLRNRNGLFNFKSFKVSLMLFFPYLIGVERCQYEVEQVRVRRRRRHQDPASQALEAGRAHVQQVGQNLTLYRTLKRGKVPKKGFFH